VRSTDWIARYGGEEFCLVMPDTDLQAGLAISERIRATVESISLRSTDERPFQQTVSIGVGTLSADVHDPIMLIERAGGATRQAKLCGRNRVNAAD
jgi:diguanylate cyclase (GGDEF)-like protein